MLSTVGPCVKSGKLYDTTIQGKIENSAARRVLEVKMFSATCPSPIVRFLVSDILLRQPGKNFFNILEAGVTFDC